MLFSVIVNAVFMTRGLITLHLFPEAAKRQMLTLTILDLTFKDMSTCSYISH